MTCTPLQLPRAPRSRASWSSPNSRPRPPAWMPLRRKKQTSEANSQSPSTLARASQSTSEQAPPSRKTSSTSNQKNPLTTSTSEKYLRTCASRVPSCTWRLNELDRVYPAGVDSSVLDWGALRGIHHWLRRVNEDDCFSHEDCVPRAEDEKRARWCPAQPVRMDKKHQRTA